MRDGIKQVRAFVPRVARLGHACACACVCVCVR
jgi:hypothetical protein